MERVLKGTLEKNLRKVRLKQDQVSLIQVNNCSLRSY